MFAGSHCIAECYRGADSEKMLLNALMEAPMNTNAGCYFVGIPTPKPEATHKI